MQGEFLPYPIMPIVTGSAITKEAKTNRISNNLAAADGTVVFNSIHEWHIEEGT
jgi:hypothetical protein